MLLLLFHSTWMSLWVGECGCTGMWRLEVNPRYPQEPCTWFLALLKITFIYLYMCKHMHRGQRTVAVSFHLAHSGDWTKVISRDKKYLSAESHLTSPPPPSLEWLDLLAGETQSVLISCLPSTWVTSTHSLVWALNSGLHVISQDYMANLEHGEISLIRSQTFVILKVRTGILGGVGVAHIGHCGWLSEHDAVDFALIRTW